MYVRKCRAGNISVRTKSKYVPIRLGKYSPHSQPAIARCSYLVGCSIAAVKNTSPLSRDGVKRYTRSAFFGRDAMDGFSQKHENNATTYKYCTRTYISYIGCRLSIDWDAFCLGVELILLLWTIYCVYVWFVGVYRIDGGVSVHNNTTILHGGCELHQGAFIGAYLSWDIDMCIVN